MDELTADLSNDLRISIRNSNVLSDVIEDNLQSQEWSFEPSMKSSSRAFPSLIKTLLIKKPNDNFKEIFSNQCRLYYSDNPSTLNMIDEFEQTYQNDKAIWWYTRNTFLYLLLNKSLRQQNIEMIIHLHFFLYDIHHQLAANWKGTNPRTTIETFYRGQIMTLTEIQLFKERDIAYSPVGINSFLSTTKDYQMALIFSGSSTHEFDDPLQSVVFTIQLLPSDFNPMDKEYADISHLSACPTEEETLFTVASSLYFDGLEYDANAKTWFIKLTNWSTSDCFTYGRYDETTVNKQSNSIDMQFIYVARLLSEKNLGYDIFDFYDEQHQNDPPVTEQSFHLIQKRYYDILLQRFLIDQFVYNVGVGSLAFMSGQMNIAAQYLLKALPNDDQINSNKDILILLYDTLGHIHRETYQYDLALEYYSQSVDLNSTDNSRTNLACIYKILGHYDQALTLSSSFTVIARACDKHRDSLSNLKEWKLFVDYTVTNEKYLSEYHVRIIREYLEIGKVNACLPRENHVKNHGDYRLKQNELPVSTDDVSIDLKRLQTAIDCFENVIHLCKRFNPGENSPSITSANEYITLTRTKISQYRIFLNKSY